MQIIDSIIDTQKEHIVQAECYPPRFIVLKALNYYDENFNK